MNSSINFSTIRRWGNLLLASLPLCVMALIASSLFAAPAPSKDKPPLKSQTFKPLVPFHLVKFPAEKPLGILSVRSRKAEANDPWQKLGKAQGEVKVPDGYDLRFDPAPPSVAEDLSGFSGLKPNDLQMLNLGSTPVGDEGLKFVGRLTGVKILNLRRTKITDIGLAKLATLREMETLYLDDTLVTDAGLAHLAGMKSLQHLNLADRTTKSDPSMPSRINDTGMAQLRGMEAMTFLDLEGAAITDFGLKSLDAMSKLYHLNLARTRISDAGIDWIISKSELSELNLSGTGVTDAGIAKLSRSQQLRDLQLNETKITERGLEHLKDLPALMNLGIRGTGAITEVGLTSLKAMRTLGTLTISKDQLSAEMTAELVRAHPKLTIQQ